MAPTEILARQHLKTIAPLAEAAGIHAAILTGRERGKERDDMPGAARKRQYRSPDRHPCAVPGRRGVQRSGARRSIDEQHRFGVHQRLALTRKGEAVDMLVMTATPIPRTLVLTYFGDMDISELREKPAGRQPVDTRTIPLVRLDGSDRSRRPRDRRGSGSIGSARWSRNPKLSDLAAAEDRFDDLAQALRRARRSRAWQDAGTDKDEAMRHSPAAKRGFWSRPP